MLFAYLVGVVAATGGCFWQSAQSIVGSVAVPIGLVAALFVTWLGGQIVVTSTSERWAPTAYAVAFIQMVLTLTATTSAGDVVVAATWYGYSFLVLSLLIVALMAVRDGMFGPRRLR